MRDVARLAKVSTATVSSVINPSPNRKVSPELTRKVNEAVAALGYHPDHVARSLRIRNTHTIGVVIPDITNPFFIEVTCGAEDEAWQNGYSVILCNSKDDPRQENQQLSTLFSRRVDGVLLATSDPYTVQYAASRKVPLILIDRVPADFRGEAVVSDNIGGALTAVRHLIQLGHERIAIITTPPTLSTTRDRVEGFRRAMQEARLVVREDYFRIGGSDSSSGYRCVQQLLNLRQPPTAIFSCNNRVTLGLMRALKELHVPCPDAMSVVGFDDSDWADVFTPGVTTVAQPSYEMGRQAFRLLLSKVQPSEHQPAANSESIRVLQTELRIRESTARPGK